MTRWLRADCQWLLSVVLASTSMIVGCGGGAGGSGNPPPAPDFTISLSPGTLALENGQSKTVLVGVGAVSTFSSNVSISVTGLPQGVAADPATFSLSPGAHQQVTLTAAATAAAAAASVAFQASSGALNHTAQLALTLSYVSPDFSVYVTPAIISVSTGSSQTVTVSVPGSNGFSSTVSVNTSGLPSGVTASPATFSLTPGGGQQVVLAVAATATAGSTPIVFTATSGTLSHSAQAALTVAQAVNGMHAPIRTRALRTDAHLYNVDALQMEPPRLSAYDGAHRQFFVSNPSMNKIDVFSAVDQVQTAKIAVPAGPWGLDVSPFDGKLYAGTLGGEIYVINTGTLTIEKRYLAATIGPSGFAATDVLALSGGQFALVTQAFGLGGVSNYMAVWDPIANTLQTGPPGTGLINICYPVGGPFAVSGDRTRVLMADGACVSGDCQVCSYDPSTKQVTLAPSGAPSRSITASPDGSRFFTLNPVQITAFDPKTLQTLGQNIGPFSGLSYPNSAVLSADSKTLYVYDLTFGAMGAFDTSTLTQIGWVPTTPASGNLTNVDMMGEVGAIDPTGLIVGPISGGVEFIDGAKIQAGSPTQLGPGAPTPDTGPSTGGTLLDHLAQSAELKQGVAISQVFIGDTSASGASFSTVNPYIPTVMATTPPSTVKGAVDTTVTLSDGAVATCMECFSYGPSIIQLASNASTAEGGGTGLLVGHGFGGTTGYAGPSSAVSVTIGGHPANILGVQAGPIVEPYPLLTDELIFSIPSGSPGTAADVTVTTSSGSTTLPGAFHYVPGTRSFPLTDSLQQGIYDAWRDLYYFAGKTQIQVLSANQEKWLPPIPLPGVTTSTHLVAIAESPDGTKVAVSDPGGQAIYVLNPDSPSSARRYSMDQTATGSYFSSWPAGLAITNAGTVNYATDPRSVELMKLDTSSGHVTAVGNGWSGGDICSACPVIQSPDGSHIYGINGGLGAFWVDPSNDQVTYSPSFGGGIGGGPFDLALSNDGTTVDVNSNFADPSMAFESTLAYADWEWFYPPAPPDVFTSPWATRGLHGEKLNADGTLLYMPLNNGIDVYARNTGRLIYRVEIPVTTASVSDPLVSGKNGNVLAVITVGGVSLVDLSSLPIASTLTRPFAASVRTSNTSTPSQLGDVAVPLRSLIEGTLTNAGKHALGPRRH